MIVAWIAFDLGLLVIELSKVGLMTKPELVLAVAANIVSELLPVPAAL